MTELISNFLPDTISTF
jgi:hypothetical protein